MVGEFGSNAEDLRRRRRIALTEKQMKHAVPYVEPHSEGCRIAQLVELSHYWEVSLVKSYNRPLQERKAYRPSGRPPRSED